MFSCLDYELCMMLLVTFISKNKNILWTEWVLFSWENALYMIVTEYVMKWWRTKDTVLPILKFEYLPLLKMTCLQCFQTVSSPDLTWPLPFMNNNKRNDLLIKNYCLRSYSFFTTFFKWHWFLLQNIIKVSYSWFFAIWISLFQSTFCCNRMLPKLS